MPSGGFGTTDAGIMHFDDAIIESIVMVFMLLTCINFSLLYFAFSGRSNEIWKDEELRTYLLIVFVAWMAMAVNIYRSDDLGYGFMESIRHSIFQAISITSTGYSSSNFSDWPVFSQFVLLLLMIIGASAGSTGGGLKVLRIRIAFELAKREVMKMLGGLSSTITSLTKVVISLLGLGIVVSLLGGNVPFVSGIADNIVGLVQALGDAGIVGLVAAIIILGFYK